MSLRGALGAALILGAGFVSGGCGGDEADCFEASGCGDGDADSDSDGDSDTCDDLDDDGFVSIECATGDDCDDHDALLSPAQEEVCNGIDDDCSGGVDEGMLADGVDRVLPLQDPLAHTELIALAASADGYGLLRLECSLNCLENDVAEADRHLTLTELAADGSPTGGSPIEISSAANYLYYDTVALAALPGGGWLVAWGETPDAVATFTDARLTIVSVVGRQVSEPLFENDERGDVSPVLGVGADSAIAVWNHADREIGYALLALDDLSVIEDGVLYEDDTLPPGGRESVAWTGERFLVAGGGEYFGSVGGDGSRPSASFLATHVYDNPVVAWNGFEGALVYYEDATSHRFVAVDAAATKGRGAEISGLGAKAQRLVGAERGFALTAVVGGDDATNRGEATFWNLGIDLSNEIRVDDVGGPSMEEDVWAVPTGDGGAWALAWIDTDRQVRIDFVRCEE